MGFGLGFKVPGRWSGALAAFGCGEVARAVRGKARRAGVVGPTAHGSLNPKP